MELQDLQVTVVIVATQVPMVSLVSRDQMEVMVQT